MKLKINNWTLALVIVGVLLAVFLPQWLSANQRDISEIKDTGASAVALAAIFAAVKMFCGIKE